MTKQVKINIFLTLIFSFFFSITFAQQAKDSTKTKKEKAKKEGSLADRSEALRTRLEEKAYGVKEMPLKDYDLSALKSTTILIVLPKNPCPDCPKKEIIRRSDLSEAEQNWAINGDKWEIDQIKKITNEYLGESKVIRVDELNNYQDTSKYRYVFTPNLAGGHLAITPGQSSYGNYPSTKDVVEWFLNDRKENIKDTVNPNRPTGSGIIGEYKVIIKELNVIYDSL